MLFRPALGRAAATGQFPVIVSDFWPYYSRYLDPSILPNPRFFAAHGYVDVVCAMRGTFTSGGTFPGWWAPTDVTDDYDVIHWAAAQPWSTGHVGQEGASYGGINTLKAGAAAPPGLDAIAPQFAFNDAYLGYFYPGGIPDDPSQSPAPGVQDYRGVTPRQQDAIWAEHPFDDAFWQQASVPAKKIRVPTLMVGGWLDYMVVGDIANYQAINPADSWLVMGPWEHALAAPNVLEPMLLAWFDHWLQHRPTAPLPTSRVLSFEMPTQGGAGWTQMSSYPLPAASHQELVLNTDRTLSSTAGPPGEQSYTVNPHDAPASICFPPGTCDTSKDMRAQDARRLTFTTSPLKHDLVVIGSVTVHLRATLSATDGNFVVKLMDAAPGGAVHEATVGYLKASHRLSQTSSSPVAAGRPAWYTIAIWPTDWRFRAGHQLRLSLTSGDSPKIAADAPAGTVTVATGTGGSYADLPAG
jgi:predicted acyl esterase